MSLCPALSLSAASRRLLPRAAYAASSAAASGAGALAGATPRRRFGILDNISSFVSRGASSAQEAKKEEVFRWQMDFMLQSATYTLADHFKLLESLASRSGATGWRKMLLTDAQKSELEEHLVDLKLADLLTPAEAANPRRELDGAARARLALKLGVPTARVNKFLDGFTQAETIHAWLLKRRAAGKALPATLEEYSHTMIADRVGYTKEAQKKHASRTKNQQSLLRRL